MLEIGRKISKVNMNDDARTTSNIDKRNIVIGNQPKDDQFFSAPANWPINDRKQTNRPISRI